MDADGEDEVNENSFLFKKKLDKIKKLLPTGKEEVDDKFFPKYKLDKLKKLLPTGSKYDAYGLNEADKKTFLLAKKLAGKFSSDGPKTGPK